MKAITYSRMQVVTAAGEVTQAGEHRESASQSERREGDGKWHAYVIIDI